MCVWGGGGGGREGGCVRACVRAFVCVCEFKLYALSLDNTYM